MFRIHEAARSGPTPHPRPRPAGDTPSTPRKVLTILGAVLFWSFLALAAYAYTVVQLLPPGDAWLAPIIPLQGSYGDSQLLPGVSYTIALEGSGALSFCGLLLYSFERHHSYPFRQKALLSLSLPLRVFGGIVAGVVYTETHIFWGELWYGVKLLTLNPEGFPWGFERVAANTCLLPASGDNCYFLNYDQLLFISLTAFLLGVFFSRKYGTNEKPAE